MGLFSKPDRDPVMSPVYATRELACPHCHAYVEVALRAVTLRCPKCAKPLQFQDAVLTRPTVDNITTLGQVSINRKASLRGKVDCGSLVVDGSLNGIVAVRGEAVITARASVSGMLSAQTIRVESGGRFRGTLNIGTPPQPATADTPPRTECADTQPV
jgi:hypothetical protein